MEKSLRNDITYFKEVVKEKLMSVMWYPSVLETLR